FGRPKGDRSSYVQHQEGGVPMTVVFEVLSPSNKSQEMVEKFHFYDDYGVEEYYVYDPQKNDLEVYVRKTATLVPVRPVPGFVSPRLGLRFDLSGEELTVYLPDGEPFLTMPQLDALRAAEKERADKAEKDAADQKERADKEMQRADDQKQRADEASRRAAR